MFHDATVLFVVVTENGSTALPGDVLVITDEHSLPGDVLVITDEHALPSM